MNQDFVAWLGQGTVVRSHARTSGSSDRGVIMMRKRFLNDLERIARGEDPKAIVRGAAANHGVKLPVAERKLLVDGLTRAELLAHPILGHHYAGDYVFRAGRPTEVAAAFKEAMGI